MAVFDRVIADLLEEKGSFDQYFDMMDDKPHRDIFGVALVDCDAGNIGHTLTIRRDDDHVDSHDPSLYFTKEPFEHEAALLHRAAERVLDVGCGAGRPLLWLKQRGVNVTGIDLSPGAIDVCRRRGCEDVRLVDIMSSATETLKDAEFQTAVLFGNNVGIVGTLDGARHFFRRLARAMYPDGHLPITGLDIAQTCDPRHLTYHQWNRVLGRPIGEITMRFENQDMIGSWVRWFYPTPDELREIAVETGWSVKELGSTYGPFYSAVLGKLS
ncbi:MAG: class I SAM-dependent methyltransferase [Paracoccaceae bacterium]